MVPDSAHFIATSKNYSTIVPGFNIRLARKTENNISILTITGDRKYNCCAKYLLIAIGYCNIARVEI